MRTTIFLFALTAIVFFSCKEKESYQPTEEDILYRMPEESELHEGTWLQWPHEYQYGLDYRDRLDDTWVAMTSELVTSETVHLVVYNEAEKSRVSDLLTLAEVELTNIDFKIYKTDDVWTRDNGPIYVRDADNKLVIENWGFNGWGNKADYENCNAIPEQIAADQNRTLVDISGDIVNEGGSVEIDGNGTLMACKSSIINNNRNRGMSQVDIEKLFAKYLGITNYIWLDGVAGLEITDMHIDGFARFGNSTTIVTMDKDDLLEWEIPQSDIDILYASTNNNGVAYNFIKIPLTQNNVVTTYGKDLGYKGSYINYYIANTKVLVPNYNDPNDESANQMIQDIYPNRTVVGIDVRNLYANGGMIHCVTQQQPEE